MKQTREYAREQVFDHTRNKKTYTKGLTTSIPGTEPITGLEEIVFLLDDLTDSTPNHLLPRDGEHVTGSVKQRNVTVTKSTAQA